MTKNYELSPNLRKLEINIYVEDYEWLLVELAGKRVDQPTLTLGKFAREFLHEVIVAINQADQDE